MKNLNPKGHGKIELRGSRLIISLNIENGEKDNYYNVILLSGLRDYELGKIYLENTTKGKGEFKINYKDFEGSGFSIDKINAILILRDKKVLLGNYINKEDGSIERYINDNIRVKEDKEVEVPEKIEEVLEVPEEIQEMVESVKDEVVEECDIKEDEYIIDKLDSPIEDIYHTEAIDLEGMEEVREIEPPVAEDPPPTDNIYHTKARELEEIQDLEETPEEESPQEDTVEEEITENQYKEAITNIFEDGNLREEEKGFLPYFSYIIGGNQKYPIVRNAIGANQLMEIYKHYIFGLYNEENRVKFYVYGIPGSFTIGEHPSRGTSGFNTWFESKEGRGYWLLYIQPSTGRIIYPLNPMIPKD